MTRNVWLIAILAMLSLGASRCEKDDEQPMGSDDGGTDPGNGDGDGDGDGNGDGDGDGDVSGVECGPSTCAEGQVCCNESCGICTEPDGACTQQFCGDPDPGGGGEECGPNTCAEGQVCCNESCGICTEPDGACTQQFCGDPDPSSPSCGGFAGIECPGAGMCVDDTSDDCDPENGGADCGGVCECSAAAVSCITNTWFNEDPAVCDCIPIDDGGGESCGPNTCAEGQVCCNESCGICTEPDGACTQQFCGDPDPQAPACGGFAGFTCPGLGECIDDTSDDCDPNNGGADCGGLCECNVGPLIDCAHVFDDSPDVCACVPN